MNEKNKYLDIYNGRRTGNGSMETVPGKMNGGYGRICWGENMLESLKAWKVESLLDVGCGYGNFCDAASLFIPRVYGLDIASVATGNIIDNPDITYIDGEAKRLPLDDNGVEWITSFVCLEHCLEEDIDTILYEFNRVASKGFVLSISYAPCEMDGMPPHMTVKPEAWWIEKLKHYGTVIKEGHTPVTNAPYLICRKPVDKRLVCYCAGGLGQRLRALSISAEVARESGRRISMVWPTDDPRCGAGFSDLFENAMDEMSMDDLLQLRSCKVYAFVKEVADQALISGNTTLRQIVRRWGTADMKALAMDDEEDNVIIYDPGGALGTLLEFHGVWIRQLVPAIPLMERIQAARTALGLSRDTMGVHARGTDFGVAAAAYADQMAKVLNGNPHQRFLVCSDDRSYEAELNERFGQSVILRRKSDWHRKIEPDRPWAVDNIQASRQSTEEVVVDTFLLAGTDFKIYHESSATAFVGQILNSSGPNPIRPDRKPEDNIDGEPMAHDYENKDSQAIKPEPSIPRHLIPRHLIRHDLTGTDPMGTVTPDISVRQRRKTGIHYLCPDIETPSAGIRRLYRHVSLLQHSGFDAHILHLHRGFRRSDMPPVSIRHLELHAFRDSDIVVIPEGFPAIMDALKKLPGRRFVIALNWDYVFKAMPLGLNWRSFDIERVLVVSPVIGQMVAWSMGLPTHVLGSSIDHQRYYIDSEPKRAQVVYIQRKAAHIKSLQRLLNARNRDFTHKIEWIGLDGLSEETYAARIRESAIFLNLSAAEGFPTSCLEAMAAGTLVAGYDSVGGRELLRGHGDDQNCILAPNGDYVTLAYRLAPALDDLLNSRWSSVNSVISNARHTAAEITLEGEQRSLTSFWDSICLNHNINYYGLNN